MDQRFHPDTRHAWSRGFQAKNLSIEIRECANHCYLLTKELIPLKPWSNLNLPMLWSFGEDNPIGWRNKKGRLRCDHWLLHRFLDASSIAPLDFALLQKRIAVTTETWKSQENIPMVLAVQSHQSYCSAEMLRMEHDESRYISIGMRNDDGIV